MSSVLIVCITGASGFLGTHLVPLMRRAGVTIRVLTRSGDAGISDGVQTFIGDLFDAQSMFTFMDGAELLINLAQPSVSVDDDRFAEGITNILDAALLCRVRRVIHVSTAVVVGTPSVVRVDESSACHPVTSYEVQKFTTEHILLNSRYSDLDIGILRPTAVFGLGGRNLRKQMAQIFSGNPMHRRLLRFVHSDRRMHLVSATDVVEAITFLAFVQRPLAGNIFFISADDESDNHYQAVDAILGGVLGAPPMPKRSLGMPRRVFQLLLMLAGRSQTNPMLIYDASKLRAWGFHRVTDFESELRVLGQSYLAAKAPL